MEPKKQKKRGGRPRKGRNKRLTQKQLRTLFGSAVGAYHGPGPAVPKIAASAEKSLEEKVQQ
jgi:hypothetical protein